MGVRLIGESPTGHEAEHSAAEVDTYLGKCTARSTSDNAGFTNDVVAYASLAVPAILAGAVVSSWGLESTFEVFGSIAAALALVVAFEAWRTRPAPPRLAMARA